MNRNYIEELVNAIRNQLQLEEKQMRSGRIKKGWHKHKERLTREKEALALVKSKH